MLSDISTHVNVPNIGEKTFHQCDSSTEPTLNLSLDSHSDMQYILKNILEDGSAKEFKLLLESQLKKQ